MGPSPAGHVQTRDGELLANPGFEAGIAGWQASPSTATFTIVSEPTHAGAWAASVTKTSARGLAFIYQDVPVTPGQRYTASVWAMWNDARLSNVKLRIEWLNANNKRIRLDDAILDSRSSDYRALRLENLTAPEEARMARIQGYTFVNTAAPIQPALFDDFSFTVAELSTPTMTTSPTAIVPPTVTTTPVSPGTVLINEVLYDPLAPGGEPGHEWIELYNTTQALIRLAGWSLRDHIATDVLPAIEIPARGFVVVAASEAFAANYPAYDGPLIVLDGAIGNGLSNAGDALWLRDAQDQAIDAVSYGKDTAALNPAVPLAPAGYSLERVPLGQDTDTAADWLPRSSPSPGQGIILQPMYLPLVLKE